MKRAVTTRKWKLHQGGGRLRLKSFGNMNVESWPTLTTTILAWYSPGRPIGRFFLLVSLFSCTRDKQSPIQLFRLVWWPCSTLYAGHLVECWKIRQISENEACLVLIKFRYKKNFLKPQDFKSVLSLFSSYMTLINTYQRVIIIHFVQQEMKIKILIFTIDRFRYTSLICFDSFSNFVFFINFLTMILSHYLK